MSNLIQRVQDRLDGDKSAGDMVQSTLVTHNLLFSLYCIIYSDHNLAPFIPANNI